MIYYLCKYTPIEIFQAMGKEVSLLDPPNSDFSEAHSYLHQNMCTYIKSVLDYCLKSNYKEDELILTNCCDSIKRLYDVLKEKHIFKNIYYINIPHEINDFSKELYYKEILTFIDDTFDTKKFIDILNNKSKSNNSKKGIYLLGARCNATTINLLNNYNLQFKNLTCTNGERCFSIDKHNSNVIKNYAEQLLNQFPCMHMINVDNRIKAFNDINRTSKAIIYNTVKFCDNYSFEYAKIKKCINIPLLKIEEDFSTSGDGQLKTRLEAFMEEIDKTNININKSSTKSIYSVGVDSGSTSTNAVVLDKDFNILSFSILRTGAKTIDSAEKALNKVLTDTSLSFDSISSIISTGYGRISIPFSNKQITEITCHAAGSHFLNKNVRTIIDIGGQDSKVIKLDSSGNVVDFVMNDKCAAGTGRFLEMMSKTLDIPLSKMSLEGLNWKENISITSMCSVFAESEVISLIAQNKTLGDIIHGVNNSVAGKIVSMAHRIDAEKEYMITGGVAKNLGVIKTIEDKLQNKLLVPFEPEIIGALGAAVIGMIDLLK